MKAYKGQPELKTDLLKEIKLHEKADDIAKGAYSENGKFCAVGCAIESLNKALGCF